MFSPTRLRSKDFGGPADRLRPSGFVESRQSGASAEASAEAGLVGELTYQVGARGATSESTRTLR